jgi:hypothetical protein
MFIVPFAYNPITGRSLCIQSHFTSPMERCKAITENLMSRTALKEFCVPIPPNLLRDYSRVISNPMDLQTVRRKIDRQQYSSRPEWYSDVSLVFDNALLYHKDNFFMRVLAEYGKTEFERLAVGMNEMAEDVWFEEVDRLSHKLTDLLGEPPSTPEPNAWMRPLRERAQAEPTLKQEARQAMVEPLNELIKKDAAARRDVWVILSEVEKLAPEAIADQEIDVDPLKAVTARMLSMYVGQRTRGAVTPK